MAHNTLTHSAILGADAQIMLVRATLDTKRPRTLHDHDFYELIWVQNGSVRHHMAELREDLREGDLLFIRPQDRHALQGRGEEALVVSVTLHPDLIAALGQRRSRQSVPIVADAKRLGHIQRGPLRTVDPIHRTPDTIIR